MEQVKVDIFRILRTDIFEYILDCKRMCESIAIYGPHESEKNAAYYMDDKYLKRHIDALNYDNVLKIMQHVLDNLESTHVAGQDSEGVTYFGAKFKPGYVRADESKQELYKLYRKAFNI